MDLLACSSCGQRFAVHGAGALGGWRCSNCDNELNLVARNAFRMSYLRSPPPSEYHLRTLRNEADEEANRIEGGPHA